MFEDVWRVLRSQMQMTEDQHYISMRQTGQTFKKVLNEYRIERAKELLRDNPDTKVGALALQVGFSNANTFIQVFKQYTGTTPHQYATRL